MNAELLMMIGGIAAFLLTLHWVRSRNLREKYAAIWLLVAFALMLCGFFPRALMMLAERYHLSYAAAVLFVALAAIYTFSFFVSVSLTRNYRRGMRLTQELAILEHRVRTLERQLQEQREPFNAPDKVMSQ
jgi:hypothetical protein